jgi:glutathione peroxidase
MARSGSRGRILGAIFIDIAIVLALGGAVYGAYTLTQADSAAIIGGSTHASAAAATVAAAAAQASSDTVAALAAPTATSAKSSSPFHQLSALDINRQSVDFSRFQGQVVLVVNVASQCGFTYQYAGLEALQREFSSQGFTVLGFPCNAFGAQEPGSNEEIAQFCSKEFHITFPLMDKIEVNGPKEHALYTYLKKGATAGKPVKWNFEKFLVDQKGRVQAHYPSTTKPEELRTKIQQLLKA